MYIYIYTDVSIVIIIIVIANYSLVPFSRTLTTRVHQVFETHSGYFGLGQVIAVLDHSVIRDLRYSYRRYERTVAAARAGAHLPKPGPHSLEFCCQQPRCWVYRVVAPGGLRFSDGWVIVTCSLRYLDSSRTIARYVMIFYV